MSRVGPRFADAPANVFGIEPAWATTGQIAVTVGTGTKSETGDYKTKLVVMSAAGQHVRTLTSGYFDRSPSWSPDGTKLAFVRAKAADDDRCPKVYTIRADGRNLTQITNGCHTSVAWSPDGTKSP